MDLAEAVLQLHPEDPVALARRELERDTELEGPGRRLTVRDTVPHGHKVALTDIAAGEQVRKYGQPIGIATRAIAAGEHVHEHNLSSLSREGLPVPAQIDDGGAAAKDGGAAAADGGAPAATRAADPRPASDAVLTFDGIVRPDGRVGTRNYVAVLSSVNCSATVVKRIAAAFSAPGALDEHPGVDGVIAITHGSGCGLSRDGEGLEVLRRTLTGYARHPNVAAVVVVGLGCEVNQINALIDGFDLPEGVPLRHLVIQELGGSVTTVRRGVELVTELLPEAAVPRQPVPASELVLGLNCGGSDGWSGVTANPVLGVAVDRLVAAGGTAILG
jgi:altronate hydrolase